MDIPIRHTMSFISGFLLIVKFHTVALGIFALSFVMFWVNMASAISKKYLVVLLPASALVAELFIGENWGALRGPMLVFLLKFLSVALTDDLKFDLNDMEQVASLMGYYFHPATMLLGPWIPFRYFYLFPEDFFQLDFSACIKNCIGISLIIAEYSLSKNLSKFFILALTDL